MSVNPGKQIRAKGIFRENGRTLIVAMDHSRGGLVPGLEDYPAMLKKVAQGGADAVLISYGNIVRFSKRIPRNLGSIMSLAPPQGPEQVELAAKVGALGVKFTHFGSITDWNKLEVLQPIAAECEKHGLIFLAEVVPQDENRKTITTHVGSATRLAVEAGADLVKTAYTGSPETFKNVIRFCPIPIVILGGPKMNTDREVLETVKGCIDAGGAGVAFGRNVFQHRDPVTMTRAIGKIIHENETVDEALEFMSVAQD